MADPIKAFRSVLETAEFGRWVSGRLCGLRLIHESDRETLERVMVQARKTLCRYCKGVKSRADFVPCSTCNGTGEVAYDPNMVIVEEVMES